MGRRTENERNQIVFIELPQICLFLRTLITGVIIIMFASVWDVCRRDGGSVDLQEVSSKHFPLQVQTMGTGKVLQEKLLVALLFPPRSRL